jgi:pimeloyl-ACP methyl ester carboxylesterase
LLLHGRRDRLVSVQVAREAARRNPAWRYREFPDVGHVPQLEVPDAVAAAVLVWLVSAGVPAPRRAGP